MNILMLKVYLILLYCSYIDIRESVQRTFLNYKFFHILTSVEGNLQEVSNHPVHIINKQGKLSPSAFIPFCEFGGNMSAMGVYDDKLKLHVCNSFQAKILNDQLCYEVDLQKFINQSNNIENDLKSGLVFFMDYNEDRQAKFYTNISNSNYGSYGSKVDWSEDDKNAFIYLNTIGKFK